MADDTYEAPPTMMGVPYWEGFLVSVIDDDAVADRAVTELRAAGFSDDDARSFRGDFVVKNHDTFMAHRSFSQRVGMALSVDERTLMNEYLDEMRKGHNFVEVRVPDEDTMNRAHTILVAHNAHHRRHYLKNQVVEV